MDTLLTIGIIIAAIVIIVILAFIGKFFSLWLQALFSKANVSIFQLIGIRLQCSCRQDKLFFCLLKKVFYGHL